MRLMLTLLTLLAILPCQAREPSEQERLTWYHHQLAVAEAPGDAFSDQWIGRALAGTVDSIERSRKDGEPLSDPMRQFLARARVVVAHLEAQVDAVRDSDPFLLGADLGCWPKREDSTTCSERRARLESLAGDNAYHGLVLMTNAWMVGDARGFLGAARLAAAAERYDSLPAIGFESMRARYGQVPLPAMSDSGVLAQRHGPEVMAMSLTAATAVPPFQHFSQPCREAEGELRAYCLAIADKMLAQGQNLIEIWIAQGVVEAIGSPREVEAARARKRETEWLSTQSLPLLGASGTVEVAGMDEYFAVYGSQGDIAAMQALLGVHGIDLVPPAGWTRPVAQPAASP